ncbi:MAG: WD40 repeat protein [Flavobacteriales bacterium]|jgi:WD40 repeat protein
MKTFLTLISLISLFTACSPAEDPIAEFRVAAKGLHSATVSDDGTHIAVGSMYHGISYWRIEDQERLYNWNHTANEATTAVAMDISDNNRWAVTASVQDLVLWDTKSGVGERYWIAPGEILDLELSPRASLALLGLSNHSAVIFDIQRGGIKRTLQHTNRVRSVDMDASGRYALTGSEDFGVRFWDIESGKLLKHIKHNDDVQLVKLSDDGSLALSVSKYDKALVWKTDSGEELGEIPLQASRLKRGIRFTAAQFSADNRYLITGRQDQIVQLWALENMKEIKRWKLPKQKSWRPTSAAVIELGFAGDNKIIAAASHGSVFILQR